jgi:hypothetical protein
MKAHTLAVQCCIKEILDRKEIGKLHPSAELITEICEKYGLGEDYIRKIGEFQKR